MDDLWHDGPVDFLESVKLALLNLCFNEYLFIGMAPKKGTKKQKTNRPSSSTTRNVLSS